MTQEAHARKVPRWVIVAAILFSVAAITRMLMQQRAQRRALRSSAIVSKDTGTDHETDAHVTLAPDGMAIIAWRGVPAGSDAADRIGVRSLTRGAHAWNEPAFVKAPEALVGGPVLASTADGATWLALSGTHAWVTRAAAGTVAFAALVDAGGGPVGATAEVPWLAASSDTAWLVFREREGQAARLVLRSLHAGSDGGSDVGERIVVAEGAGLAAAIPSLCVDGARARVYVTWLDPGRGVVLSAGDGARFAREREVVVSAASDAVALDAPRCLVRGDEVTVLYGLAAAPLDPSSATPLAALVLARATDGGKTFAARTRVEEPGLVMLRPAMARDAAGPTTLIYYAARNASDAYAALRWRRVTAVGGPADDGREARAPLRLALRKTDPGWPGDHIGLVAGSGLVGAAFVDNLEGTHVAFMELGP